MAYKKILKKVLSLAESFAMLIVFTFLWEHSSKIFAASMLIRAGFIGSMLHNLCHNGLHSILHKASKLKGVLHK